MPGREAAFDAALPAIADELGTPCYVYSLDRVWDQVRGVRAAFERRFELSYAVKSNPNPTLLGLLREGPDAIEGLDVSSGGEVERALEAGWPAKQLGFTGPAKNGAELRLAVDLGVPVVLESLSEAHALARAAAEADRIQDVLVRLAPAKIPPGFGVQLAGRPTQFGIDEELVGDVLPAILDLDSLRLVGLHAYSATQGLEAAAVADNLAIQADLFMRIARTLELHPDRLVFGAAFGVPYHDGDEPLDLDLVAAQSASTFESLDADDRCRGARRILELGRYLVGEAGVYLVRVVRIKESRGQRIAICDGGMNHHAAAAGNLGSVLHRNFPLARVSRGTDGPRHSYEVVGPLCTTIDRLGHNVELPELEEGDVIAIRSSGAYGLTASPLHFISHSPPREGLVRCDSSTFELQDVTWIQSPD